MVATINKPNLGGVPLVSYWTCHHGKDVPATTIALDNLYGPPNDEKDDILAKDDSQPPATQILDKNLETLGGAQKLAGLKSFAPREHKAVTCR